MIHCSCAFVYITVSLFRLAMPCGHGLAFLLTNVQHRFTSENYHFQSCIVKFLLNNTLFYRKWLNLNTTECVLFYTYTAHSVKYSTLTCFTVYNIWLVNFIDFIDFYDFKFSVPKNSLADLNETYTHYRRGNIELTYQFSRWFYVFIKTLEIWTLSAIDVFYGLVGACK